MFHYFGVVQNTRGDALPGWQVEVVQVSDGQTVVPIFADESSTPIASISGVANRAVADENGNVDLFVASGTYSLKFYNANGLFQRTQRYLSMYGAPDPMPIVPLTGTSHTIAADNVYKALQMTNVGAITLTIPTDAAADIDIGAWLEIHQNGVGAIAITPDTGVTLNTRGGTDTTAGQYAVAGLRKTGTNTWLAMGDLV